MPNFLVRSFTSTVVKSNNKTITQTYNSLLQQKFMTFFSSSKLSDFSISSLLGRNSATSSAAATTTSSASTASIQNTNTGPDVPLSIVIKQQQMISVSEGHSFLSIDDEKHSLGSSSSGSGDTRIEEESTDMTGKAEGRNRMNYDLVFGTSYISKGGIAKGHFDTSDPLVGTIDGVTRPDCGEDAFFTLKSPTFSCFGVADGVGGWNALGINPALFAWEMMDNAKSIASSKQMPMPWEIIEEAYEKTKTEGKVEAGSSTACIVTLDKQTGVMHSANLGDSGCLVIRVGLQSEEDMDSVSTTSTNSSVKLEHHQQQKLSFELVYQARVLQHYFNAPYQLAILPKGITDYQRRCYMNDHPRVAHKASHGPLEAGDIVIMATDGLFDNLFVEEVCEVLQNELGDFYVDFYGDRGHEIDLFSPAVREKIERGIQKFTQEVVERAAYRSVSDLLTPFSKEARVNGWDDCTGGKIDDITVIAGLVLTKEYAEPMALL